ncbi:hypothetical protein R3P38DRAFT_2795824 [Favolaschia claudopus]|uniref:PilZ domain-containing protein n=1 Tax=Favolaschia claudopus TaxID=2862362 RepID=A0AAW0A5X2_9AGAR
MSLSTWQNSLYWAIYLVSYPDFRSSFNLGNSGSRQQIRVLDDRELFVQLLDPAISLSSRGSGFVRIAHCFRTRLTGSGSDHAYIGKSNISSAGVHIRLTEYAGVETGAVDPDARLNIGCAMKVEFVVIGQPAIAGIVAAGPSYGGYVGDKKSDRDLIFNRSQGGRQKQGRFRPPRIIFIQKAESDTKRNDRREGVLFNGA